MKKGENRARSILHAQELKMGGQAGEKEPRVPRRIGKPEIMRLSASLHHATAPCANLAQYEVLEWWYERNLDTKCPSHERVRLFA